MDGLEYLIAAAGQTQEGRPPAALAPHFADVEERSAEDLYAYLRALAGAVNFVEVKDGKPEANGDWTPFFGDDLPAARDGAAAPHLALLAAFLKLYRVPRCAMNGITARHLEFFYRRVLGFEPLGARPDRAHLVLELKKGAAEAKVTREHAFSAGKDASGAERIYSPTGETVLRPAKVEKLSTVFVDPQGGTVCFAPVANSADGFGPAFKKDEPWRGLGHPGLPAAPIGFAVASPVLRMKEGTRHASVTLELDGLPPALTDAELQSRFECFVTGEKRWLGPYALTTSRVGTAVSFAFTVPAGEEAVADYNAAKHAHAFSAAAPVVQVLLRTGDEAQKPRGYADFLPVVVRSARVSVEVSGITTLELESDLGPLDARRAFLPFGPQPVSGSRFLVGCAEALSKKLSALKLELGWLGLRSFSAIYAGYTDAPTEASVTVQAMFRDAAGHSAGAARYPLFQPLAAGKVTLDLFSGGRPGRLAPALEALPVRRIRALASAGSERLHRFARRELLRLPVFAFAEFALPAPRPGFITLTLDRDLGHTQYRSALLARTPLANEPYTPTLSSIALSYTASSDTVRVESAAELDFAAADAQFFHVGCFGQRREHGWLRAHLAPPDEQRVPLLPAYEDEGELLIGISSVAPGDSVSLLVKVAEGSADPDVERSPEVRWAVLGDNYWKPLAGGDAVRDGTNNLLATGIVALTIPQAASTGNSFLPAGLVWLKASVKQQVSGVCALVSVAANGIEVERRPGSAAPEQLWTPLPSGTINRLKTPIGAVKSAAQPFASFGGLPPESARALDLRAAERLRHRNCWITAWDYERAVLAAFPEIRKAKCIAHSSAKRGWLDPGHVMVVVVPDLRLRNAVDPLEPRADADTLARIREHLGKRSPMRIGIEARNPRYQRIGVDFRVRFRPGYEFNYYSRQLSEEIVEQLSPWLTDPGRAISFGGTVYKSALIDFVEHRDYVDFVTDFRMFHRRGGPKDGEDVSEAVADAPDAILVSEKAHRIAEFVEDGA